MTSWLIWSGYGWVGDLKEKVMLECPFAIPEEGLMIPTPPSTPGLNMGQGALMSLIV